MVGASQIGHRDNEDIVDGEDSKALRIPLVEQHVMKMMENGSTYKLSEYPDKMDHG